LNVNLGVRSCHICSKILFGSWHAIPDSSIPKGWNIHRTRTANCTNPEGVSQVGKSWHPFGICFGFALVVRIVPSLRDYRLYNPEGMEYF
jgi:hypothetical protein